METPTPADRQRPASVGDLPAAPATAVAAAAAAATAAAAGLGSLDILLKHEPEWRTVARQAFARVDQEGSGYVRRAEVVLAAR